MSGQFALRQNVGKTTVVWPDVRLGPQQDSAGFLAVVSLVLRRDQDDTREGTESKAAGNAFGRIAAVRSLGKMRNSDQRTADAVGQIDQRGQPRRTSAFLCESPAIADTIGSTISSRTSPNSSMRVGERAHILRRVETARAVGGEDALNEVRPPRIPPAIRGAV